VPALPILTRNDEMGVVFVQDERPDGTIVVLTCRAAGGQGGVAAPSHQPQEEEFWYPLAEQMGLSAQERGLRGRQFRLVLDTSQLPAGQLSFDVDRFVERAREAADEGESIIHLNENTAASWGLEAPAA
jgi:hypothetical protein